MKRIGAVTSIVLLAVATGACDGNGGAASPSVGTTSSASAVAATSTAPAPPPQPVPPTIEAQLRGYFSPTSFWDHNFTPATSSDCVLQGANSLDSSHAWRLPGGGLVCSWGPLPNDSWGGRVMTFKVFFDPHVNAQTAVAAVTSILPADSQQAGSFDGANGDDSKYPKGSCVALDYSSSALGDAVTKVSPTWTGDRDKVNFDLYSGNASGSDGADKPYDPESIHLALVGIGGTFKRVDGVIHC